MGSKRHSHMDYQYSFIPRERFSNMCCCNLRMLTILILIILQFGEQDVCLDEEDNDDEAPLIDNSILFIIALHFLTCCL